MNAASGRTKLPAIIGMILLGVVGAHTTVILPLLVSSIMTSMALDSASAGWIAAAEMGGVALGALIIGLRVAAQDRRMLAAASAAIALGANLLSLFVDDLGLLLILRFSGAIGGGGLLAVMAASVGDTDRSEAIFGIFIAVTFSLAALDFAVLPGIVEQYGRQSLFMFLALANAVGFAAALFIPAKGSGADRQMGGAAPWDRAVWIGLASILSYYVGVGGVWALMAKIGVASGVSDAAVNAALARASMAGIAGAMTASFAAARLPRRLVIALGLSGVAASLLAIVMGQGAGIFGVASLILLFCWNMTVPFLMGALAMLDRSGRAVAINMTVQYFGMSIGPLLAGQIAAMFGVLQVGLMGVAGALGAMALMLLALRIRP